jgi:hypothetical protein
MAARRSNARKSRGPVTPEGKARAAVAHLQHGYYSKAAEVALTALGEDPAEFKRRLDSLIDTFEPADALEMGLVYRNARSLWRMERFDRIAESMVVKRLEQTQKGKQYVEAVACLAINDKLERLKALFAATCLEAEPVVGPEAMKLFEKAQHDVPEVKAKEILHLLLRLRKPGTAVELDPELKALIEDDEIPVVQAEGRRAAGLELGALLAPEIQSLEKQILQPADVVKEQFERDILLAKAQQETAEMNRREESSLRQVWRTTQLLMKIKKAAQIEKDAKNEGWSE